MTKILSSELHEALRQLKAGRVPDAAGMLQRLLDSQQIPPPNGGNGLLSRVGHWLKGESGPFARRTSATPEAPHPPHPPRGRDTGEFLSRSFTNEAGTRPYRLYVPASYSGRPVPLIVMLHGCSQSPDDFAAGTRMNLAAEANGFLVAYPGQVAGANMQKCWNWFVSGHQQRDAGEPSLIAGITGAIIHDYAIDPKRIYVAGLSAGGAAAAIMGARYPDLFAAVGVHSGLACGAASDMQSALMAMQRGAAGTQPASTGGGRRVPVIIFHGDHDATVNVRNGDAVAAQAAAGGGLTTRTEEGRAPLGHAWRRTIRSDESGQTIVEQWTVHGGGHAWYGGSQLGSFTDSRGPDATGEMVRFFLEHPLHPRC